MSIELNVIGEISNVIATAIAGISVYLTVKEQKEVRKEQKEAREEQKEARKYDKSRILLEQKFRWYNDLMLHEVISSVNEFIEYSQEQIQYLKCKSIKELSEDEFKTVYQTIKEKNKITKEKVFMVKLFSEDLCKECTKKLDDMFDLYSTVIDESQKRKYVGYVDEYNIQKKKTEIFQLLYQELQIFIDKM